MLTNLLIRMHVNACSVVRGEPTGNSTDYDLNSVFPLPLFLLFAKASARGPEPDILCMIEGWLAGSFKVDLFKNMSMTSPPPLPSKCQIERSGSGTRYTLHDIEIKKAGEFGLVKSIGEDPSRHPAGG